MKIFRNFEEIIDFAIESEMDEIQFYSELAETMERKNVKQLFRCIALEKTARMLQLESMKEIGVLLDIESVHDLKIAGSFSEIDYTKKSLSYQEALIMAMNKEKEKFILYQELADCTADKTCKQTFLSLANQEARQKLKLEIEYDEFVLSDN
ncbi:ferritin family protein [Ancylomarina sp. YFZ004]